MCNAEKENLLNTKPCLYNKEVECVQYPKNKCGCNPCSECEVKKEAEPTQQECDNAMSEGF